LFSFFSVTNHFPFRLCYAESEFRRPNWLIMSGFR